MNNYICNKKFDNLKYKNMKTKQHFPGEYGYKDIIKFKVKGKILEGMIVGITVSCNDTDNEYVTYKVHSLEGAEDSFYFYEVRDSKIIKD